MTEARTYDVTDGAMRVDAISSSTPGPRSPWYAFRLRANSERAVESLLRSDGIETFLPLYPVESRWSDRVKTVQKVLFPGYVFARTSDPSALLDVRGVCGIVGGNLAPQSVPDAEIELVRLVVSSLLPMSPSDFLPGEAVTVRSGALQGVQGVVIRSGRGLRLVISVASVHAAFAVEIEASMLVKAAA